MKYSVIFCFLFSLIMLSSCGRRSTSLSLQPTLADNGAFCPSDPTAPERDMLGATLITVTVNIIPIDDGRRVAADVIFNGQNAATGIPSFTDSPPRYIIWDPQPPSGRRFDRVISLDGMPSLTGSAQVTYSAGAESIPCNDGDVIQGPSPVFTVSPIITSIEVIADTGGDDISHDKDCRCDSQLVSLVLAPIALEFELDAF